MWSSIANLKENLNKIALDVHDDDDEELGIYVSVATANGGIGSPSMNGGSSGSDRRNSRTFANFKPVSRFSTENGIDETQNSEIEQYKVEIKRLQESEREIKALSMNYAALLKDKEDQISRLNKENGSMKQTIESSNAALSAFRNGSSDQSPRRQLKVKSHSSRNQMQNGSVSKPDGMINWGEQIIQSNTIRSKGESEHSAFPGKEKELADTLERNRSSAVRQDTVEISQLKKELEREREELANLQVKLQEEHKLNEKFQEELKMMRVNEETAFMQRSNIQKELNDKISEISRLEIDLNRQENENVHGDVQRLKNVIATLEKENINLKLDKEKLETAMELNLKNSTVQVPSGASQALDKHSSLSDQKLESSETVSGNEELQLLLQKADKDLRETRKERDKTLQELMRLKQHLIEKESEESEKMDEDSKIIEELRQINDHQRSQIFRLEKSLKQAIVAQEEAKMTNYNEIHKSQELIEDLNKKLMHSKNAIEAKNIELLNLQTALGQYYAEIEAKEHLEANWARAREESSKLSRLLKDADEREQVHKSEKQEILAKLSLAEQTLAEWKSRVSKIEEDNSKLRRALEHSMTRLNRMSLDSDFLVDRRIVIKLLVTYFQRSHSKEVLDLMVRMLGFSDEDKQRIGAAQQGPSKGVVRGVLGLPGRLVGGILGGSSTDAAGNAASENQSFADLWVDFLLKETEERERREGKEDNKRSQEDLQIANQSAPEKRTSTADARHSFSSSYLSSDRNSSSPFSGNFRQAEHSDSEFSTVPLTSVESSYTTRLPPTKYRTVMDV